MRLVEKQQLFAFLISEFILECDKFVPVGFDGFTFGDTTWDPYDNNDTRHSLNSNHRIRLAVDLNLFVMGEYIRGEHELWEPIGVLWEGMDPLCRWGGRFHHRHRDYNHFSLRHNNVS